MSANISDLQVLCLFQLGTPPQPYVVVEDTISGEVAIVRTSQEVYDFLLAARIPVCEPMMAPPGSLANLDLLCIFRLFIGAQEAIPYVVGRDFETGEVAIIQINNAVFDFLRQLGVPVCPILNIPMVS